MGVSYHVYLGPYIQVYNPFRKGESTIQSCPEPACQNNGREMREKFCGHCGTKITAVKVASNEKISFDCYKETKDRFAELMPEQPAEGMEDFIILVPNVGKHGRNFCAYDTKVEAIPDTTPLAEIERMLQEFAPELKRLNKVFGAGYVEYKWGVIAYAS